MDAVQDIKITTSNGVFHLDIEQKAQGNYGYKIAEDVPWDYIRYAETFPNAASAFESVITKFKENIGQIVEIDNPNNTELIGADAQKQIVESDVTVLVNGETC